MVSLRERRTQGRISLCEVSELTCNGAVSRNDIAIPALKVRRAKTTLELPSGGTLAMAGRVCGATRQAVEGVPGRKSMPRLGAVFRSNDHQREESELAFLVTPSWATHVAKAHIAGADKGVAPSSTLRALWLGLQPHLRVPGPGPRGHNEATTAQL